MGCRGGGKTERRKQKGNREFEQLGVDRRKRKQGVERGGFRMRKEQLEIRRKSLAGEKECQGWDENNQGGGGRQRQAAKCRTTRPKEEEGDIAVLVYGRRNPVYNQHL